MEMETSIPWVIQQTFSNEPTKKKMTMKTKNMLWAALSMTAALVMTACSSDDIEMTEKPLAPSATKTIPYTVTVSDGAETRATVDSDNKTLKFADGDKLYVTGTNIKGVLDIQTGATTASATFSGDLTYSGEGSPADDLALTATLVSSQQTVGTQVSVDDAGAVTVNYPTTAYCTSVNDAVQKYSNLTGTSTYGIKSFSLTQQTAFLNFEITVTGGVTGTTLPARFINNGATIKADVTTVTDGGVKAKFVLPVAKGTALSSATVKLGGKEITSAISNTTLSTGKVYNVKRTVDMSSVTLADAFTDDAVVSVTVNTYNSSSNSATGTYSAGTYTSVTGSEGTSGVSMTKDGSNLVVTMTSYYNTYTVTFNTTNNTYVENATSAYSVWRMKDLKSITINGVDITSTLTAVPSETITLTGGGMGEITYSGTHFQVTGVGDDSSITVDKWSNMVISAKTGKTIVDVVFSYVVEMNLNDLTFSSGTFNGSNMVENVNATSLTVGSTNTAGTPFNGVTIYYSE